MATLILCKVIRIQDFDDFCQWIPESWALESGFQLLESAIPLTIWNPVSKFHWQGIRNPVAGNRNPQRGIQESETVVDYLTHRKGTVPFLAKFVVSRCAFCKLRRNFAFSVLSIILEDLLGNTCMFTCTSSKGHGLWFVIGGFRSVLFVSCFKVGCFVIVLFRAIIDQLRLLRRFFCSFSFLSLAMKSNVSLLPSTKIHAPSRFPSLFLNSLVRVILSQAGRTCYIVICINPAFSK